MKVREFLVQIPYLCGAKNAARISEIFGYVFDRELEKGTPFDRNEADLADFGNRSEYLWDMLYADEGAMVGAVTYCKGLMEIIERTHYQEKHGEKFHAKYIDNLAAALKEDEKTYPEIAQAMPIEEAVTLDFWNY